jgi:hypothetical protein
MSDAYAAGLVDGEGCVYVAHRNERNFYPRVDIGMSEKGLPALRMLQSTYGGTIRQTRQRSERWEAAKAWAVFGPAAASFLERIRPFLVLKAEQADLAVGLQRMVDSMPRRPNGSAAWSAEARTKAKAIRALVMDLNRKGPTDAAKEGWIARYAGGMWLTPQRDMFGEVPWAQFSGTWPEAGIMRNGYVYPQPSLVRRTGGTGSGLLPTPSGTSNHGKNHVSGRLDEWGGSSNPFRGTEIGKLHSPRFEEWMMGFPDRWTELTA